MALVALGCSLGVSLSPLVASPSDAHALTADQQTFLKDSGWDAGIKQLRLEFPDSCEKCV